MKKSFIYSLFLSLIMVSCKTYTITPESLKKQFLGVDSESLELKNVRIAGMYNKKFFSNNLATIIVKDKENKTIEMVNRPSIEMRITTIDKKRHIMYFDTVYLENDTLFGFKARLMSLKKTKIPFNKIIKIEVQNGKKNYKSIGF